MRQSAEQRRTVHRKHLAFTIPNARTSGDSSTQSEGISVVMDEACTAGDAIAVINHSSSELRGIRARPDSESYNVIGIALTTVSAGAVLAVRNKGIYTNSRYNFAPGKQLYVTNNAVNIANIPLETESVFEIGTALTPNTILINIALRVIRKPPIL